MKRIISSLYIVVGVVSGLAMISARAADATAGKQLAAKCTSCHGAAGEGTAAAPPIAGKAPEQLVQLITAYRSGERNHMMMGMVVKNLSDQEIADVSAYFASLKSP